ncbi:uncharacterized protein RCC_09490 [Ramularia collo-cygni]|uniref:Uncharacterized protein n=1 Tax=Ramularia collo-cygni TaxID=112498 RepID=A0A2D3V325_9PEZI|nr:uncharacterized protein RCC_09490 [Ramularia collo-cygni]CZT23776.1 uncharacterized protein RCC_09490 [Ramularia collo-cygni]
MAAAWTNVRKDLTQFEDSLRSAPTLPLKESETIDGKMGALDEHLNGVDEDGLERQLGEKDVLLKERDETLREKDKMLKILGERLKGLDVAMERDEDLNAGLKRELGEKEKMLTAFGEQLNEKDARIKSLDKQIEERAAKVARLREKIALLLQVLFNMHEAFEHTLGA